MIEVKFTDNASQALARFSSKVVNAAMRRAIGRVLDSTRSALAKDAAKELKVKQSALRRAIKVSKPQQRSGYAEGSLSAKKGDFIPLAAHRHRVSWIYKTPRNYTRSQNMKRYQRVAVKFWGRSNYQVLPGVFRARFRANGGNHLALAMRRSRTKRLPLRELFTNQPDMATPLIRRHELASRHAGERFGKELEMALNYYAKQEAQRSVRKAQKG
jgi:hypothetical protein